MTRRVAGRRELLSLVCIGVALLFAAAALPGCRQASPLSERRRQTTPPVAQEANPATGTPFFSGYIDFREWASKKSSLAEAEKTLGIKVRAPADTRGRKLQQIYVLETYSDGQPVARWDQAAILDYGDFVVGFDVCGSSAAAEEAVEARIDKDAEAAGLACRAQVQGRPASVWQKGEMPIVLDANGKTVRPAIYYRASVVSWSSATILLSVSSSSVSVDQLLAVAESIDYN